MRVERAAVAVVAAILALGAACGGERDPVRIGVLTECGGLLGQTREPVLAAASLPLLERGGSRAGERASGSVDGRPVELVPACTEFTLLHLLILATRRLVEVDGVDVVVGPIGGTESVVLRDLASRYPDVTFLAADVGSQETTLRDAPPNLFRFVPDLVQGSAGLGTYAYRDLGWRRAVVVGDPWYPAWEAAAGFVAEFCALGGAVLERDFLSLAWVGPAKAARRHAGTADGVFLFSSLNAHLPYLSAYVAAARPVSRRLLLSGGAFLDRKNLAPQGVDLSGVTLGSFVPLAPGAAGMRRYRGEFGRRFPHLPAGTAESLVVLSTYTTVAAVLAALDVTSGELGEGHRTFRLALSELVLDAPQGAVRLDRNHQASQAIYLERIGAGKAGAPIRPLRSLEGVEQTYGGIFTSETPPPSVAHPTCERRPPPPWAK